MNPIVALILANVIWGAAPPIFKFALTNIPPFTLAFIRFFFAGLIFLPFMLQYPFKTITKRDWIEIILGAIFGISINIAFLFLGLQMAPSINSSIISCSTPLFMFILSVIFLHEAPKLKVLSGNFIALLGVLTIIFSPLVLSGSNIVLGEMTGNFFYVISRFGTVLGAVVLKYTLKRVSPFVVTGMGFIFSGITFLPYMMKELETWSFSQLAFPGWLGIIFGVLFSSALAYYLFYYGLSKIPAEDAGVFMYIDPAITVLVAIPLLGEYPNAWFMIGTVLIFMGIYISEGRIQYHPFHKLQKKK